MAAHLHEPQDNHRPTDVPVAAISPAAAPSYEVHYRLNIGEAEVPLNALVGGPLQLSFTGRLFCIRCGAQVRKLFHDGFCYDCFRAAPEASECIVRPELCQAHLGIGRDPGWEEEHHNQPHAVYFAVTSAIKVGVTREVQIPTRWIDQGAEYAVQIARVPYRQLAGQIEVALKAHFTDRTAWQRMLKHELASDADLGAAYMTALAALPTELSDHLLPPAALQPIHLRYPVLAYPQTVRAVNLAAQRRLTTTLQGIRGQYLVGDAGAVLNVRRHGGFEVLLEVG